jgi:cytochrome c-type biogenesis protein CcmI
VTGWTFWIVAALLTAGAVALLLRRLFATDAAGAAGSDAAIYRDQLKELERERAAGEIGVAEAEAAKAEIARRLLAAAGQAQPAVDAPAMPPRPHRAGPRRAAAGGGAGRSIWPRARRACRRSPSPAATRASAWRSSPRAPRHRRWSSACFQSPGPRRLDRARPALGPARRERQGR